MVPGYTLLAEHRPRKTTTLHRWGMDQQWCTQAQETTLHRWASTTGNNSIDTLALPYSAAYIRVL